MTTIITRLYPDAAKAESVADALKAGKIPGRDIDVISGAGDHGSVKDRLTEAGVTEGNADAYAARIEGGNALVVVRAGFNPRGAALTARKIVDDHDPMDLGLEDENVYVQKEMRDKAGLGIPKVLRDHPLMLSSDMATHRMDRLLVSQTLGLPLLKKHRSRRSAIEGGAHMSYRFLPIPLLSEHKRTNSVIHGGYLITKAMGMRMISPRRGRRPV